MTRRILFAAIICAAVGVTAIAEERQWQSGTWRETNIERPKVMFSVQSRDPNSNLPRTVRKVASCRGRVSGSTNGMLRPPVKTIHRPARGAGGDPG